MIPIFLIWKTFDGIKNHEPQIIQYEEKLVKYMVLPNPSLLSFPKPLA